MGTYACEICGCGNSNFQIGLLPNFNKGFIGIRYGYSKFNSAVRDDASEFSHDYYQTMEVWGGYNIRKIQVMAFMPYVVSRKESDDGVTRTKGLGDFMVLLNYNVLSFTTSRSEEKTAIRNELFVGGGVKFPTGANQVDPSNPDFNIGDFNSQAGTGSFDYIVNATHNVMWNKSGIVTNLAYRVNTSNHQDYRFGNRAYASASFYYTFSPSVLKVKPNAGLSYQSNRTNVYQGAEVEESHGYNLNATIGVNVLRNKLGFNVMAFLPVAQNNYGGQTELKTRILAGITVSF